MLTLLFLVLLAVFVLAGQLSMFDIDLSAFPGGLTGVVVLAVVALLLSRRI